LTPTPLPAVIAMNTTSAGAPSGFPSMLPMTGTQPQADSAIQSGALVAAVIVLAMIGLIGFVALLFVVWLYRARLLRFAIKHVAALSIIVMIGGMVGVTTFGIVYFTAPPAPQTFSATPAQVVAQRVDPSMPRVTFTPQARVDDGIHLLDENSLITINEWNAQFVQPERPATRLLIPKLSIDTPLVEAPIVGNTWDVTRFTDEVAHLEGTAFPGTFGNTVVAGHVTNVRGDGPFIHLNELQSGDAVLFSGDGAQYRYVVQFVRYVQPDEVAYAMPTEDNVVTLITCTGWDETAKVYTQRLIVRAALTI
jgi:LPXTG-site transpeptidase (sortase) family protein